MSKSLPPIKGKSNYKYLIHALLNQLPHNQYKLALRYLPHKIGVSSETFRKWKYIKKTDRATIPSDHLAVIAKFFKISIEEMFNYEIEELSIEMMESTNEEE